MWRNKEDGSQLVLVAVEADDSPDTLFDGLSDDSLMAAADAVLEGYGADLAPTAAAARIGAAKLVPGAAARARLAVRPRGGVGPRACVVGAVCGLCAAWCARVAPCTGAGRACAGAMR